MTWFQVTKTELLKEQGGLFRTTIERYSGSRDDGASGEIALNKKNMDTLGLTEDAIEASETLTFTTSAIIHDMTVGTIVRLVVVGDDDEGPEAEPGHDEES